MSKWTPNTSYPGKDAAGDTAVINHSISGFSIAYALTSVSLVGASLTIATSQSLSAGIMTIGAGRAFSVSGTGEKAFYCDTLDVNGSIGAATATRWIYIHASAGGMDVGPGSTVGSAAYGHILDDEGPLVVQATGTLTLKDNSFVASHLTVAGTVAAQTTGTPVVVLTLDAAAAGASINCTGGTFTNTNIVISSLQTYTVSGDIPTAVQFTGGALTMETNASITSLTVAAGTINMAAYTMTLTTLTLAGTVNMTLGTSSSKFTVTGPGTVNGGTLNVTAGAGFAAGTYNIIESGTAIVETTPMAVGTLNGGTWAAAGYKTPTIGVVGTNYVLTVVKAARGLTNILAAMTGCG